MVRLIRTVSCVRKLRGNRVLVSYGVVFLMCMALLSSKLVMKCPFNLRLFKVQLSGGPSRYALKCNLLSAATVGEILSVVVTLCVSWPILLSLLSSGIMVSLLLVMVSIGGLVFPLSNNGVNAWTITLVVYRVTTGALRRQSLCRAVLNLRQSRLVFLMCLVSLRTTVRGQCRRTCCVAVRSLPLRTITVGVGWLSISVIAYWG